MNPQTREYLRGLGAELTPPMIQATRQLFAPRFAGLHADTRVSRDHRYGPDERHRLDVFAADGRRDAPVLVFVHGGGFVAGDKRAPDAPFYDNIGDFAVRSGWVGVTMTYRLAPAHPWPAGSEDVAAAVGWLRAHAADHGGDPRRIFLVGQSAGAVHVAGYLVQHAAHGAGRAGQPVPHAADGSARTARHGADGSGVAGALLISGSYDAERAEANAFHCAYYGEDRRAWAARSTLDGLVATDVPLLFTVSEFDAADFQRQAGLLAAAYTRAHDRFPRLHWLADHNHVSPALAVGSPEDALGPLIRDFIATAGR